MGFCTDAEYEEFLRFCPLFEQSLQDEGIQLVKYWLSVSDEEQERRFEKRLTDPRKRWKFSPVDLQSRARWVDYAEAKDRMFARTDTEHSPWYVVEADDKRTARLNLISHLLSLVPYEQLPTSRPGQAAAAPAARLPAPAEGHRARSAGPLPSALTASPACGENRRCARAAPDPRTRGDLERVARRGPRRAGTRAGGHGADRHRPDEPEPPDLLPRSRGGAGGHGRRQARLRRPDEPGDRASGMGAYYREIALLPGARRADRRPARRLPPGRVRRRRGLVHAGARGHARGAVPGDQIAGCTVARGARWRCATLARVHAPVLGDLALGTADFLNQPNPLDQALLDAAAARRSSSATASASAPEHAELCRRFVAEPRRLGGRPPAAGSVSCTATTGSTTCCSPATGARRGRLADGELGAGDARRLLLHRRLPRHGRRPARRGAGAARRLPRRTLAEQGVDGLLLRAVLGGVPAACASTAC